MDRQGELGLRRFRLALTSSTRRTSPLTLAIIAAQGPPLTRIVRWLRPLPGDAHRDSKNFAFLHLLRHAGARLVAAHYARDRRRIVDAMFRSRFEERGVVVRKPSHPVGRYAIRIAGGTLNVEVGIGDHVLVVEGATARLRLAKALPDAIQATSIGRPIGSLVSHSLTDDSRWPITAVTTDRDGTTTIEFDTGLVRTSIEFPQPVPKRRARRRPRRR